MTATPRELPEQWRALADRIALRDGETAEAQAYSIRERADELEAALATEGEAVAYRVRHPTVNKGQWLVVGTIAFIDMSHGWEVQPLYTTTPAVGVDEAMVERACASFYGSDWLRDGDEGFNPKVNAMARSEMRDAIEAALKDEPTC